MKTQPQKNSGVIQKGYRGYFYQAAATTGDKKGYANVRIQSVVTSDSLHCQNYVDFPSTKAKN